MNLESRIEKGISKALKELHGVDINQVEFQATRKDFEGDITVVVFAFLKHIKTNPVAQGNALGKYMV